MSSTRSRRLLVSGRVLLVSAGVLAAGTAWWWATTDNSARDAAVLEVETAVASLPPATIAPLPAAAPDDDPPPPDEPPPAPMPTIAPNPVDTTIPLSPLAELLGERGSAIPPVVEPRVRPMVLGIGEIGVLHPVRAVGLEENGELEIPDETEIGWYRYGAAPGQPGATVLAAHVTWNSTTGPFFRLGDLAPGEAIHVALDDGSQRVYEVVERTMYDKDALPPERIWRTTGPETLVLITCGGDFNPDIRRYRQNIVVYAVPVEQHGSTAT